MCGGGGGRGRGGGGGLGGGGGGMDVGRGLAAGGVPPLVLVVAGRVEGRLQQAHGDEELVVALDVLAAVAPAGCAMRMDVERRSRCENSLVKGTKTRAARSYSESTGSGALAWRRLLGRGAAGRARLEQADPAPRVRLEPIRQVERDVSSRSSALRRGARQKRSVSAGAETWPTTLRLRLAACAAHASRTAARSVRHATATTPFSTRRGVV